MIVQTDPRAPRVVLVGPPGAGKSTIGRKLAKELGVDLYDTDAGIERETGRTIPEIFAADGEPEFRRIEERVVRRAILAERGVVSLGGGAVLSKDTRALLRNRTVVYLEISVAEGLRRTGASNQRPLLNGDDPGAKYRELMRKRRPLYREVATVRVRTDGRSPGRVVRMILDKLGIEPATPSADPEPEATATADGTVGTPEGQGSSRSRARRRARARAAARRAAAKGSDVAGSVAVAEDSAATAQDAHRATAENAGEGRSATTAGSPRNEGSGAERTSGTGADAPNSGSTAEGASSVRRRRPRRRRPSARTSSGEPSCTESTAPAAEPQARSWLPRLVASGARPEDTRATPTSGRTRRPRACRPAGAPNPAGSQASASPVAGQAVSATPAPKDTEPATAPAAAAQHRPARIAASGAPAEPVAHPAAAESAPKTTSSGRARRARARRVRTRALEQSARTESEQQ